jgi:hypothetical protein
MTNMKLSQTTMHRTAAIVSLFWFAGAAAVSAAPAQVLLIRHAEKPDVGDDLSLKGRQRAAALAPYFLETAELLTHGKPVAVYAQQPSDNRPSRRCLETVKPLAAALDLRVQQYMHRESGKMVKSIMKSRKYEGKTVVICWDHDELPEIAAAFGVADPPEWSARSFDRVWIITFEGGRVRLKDAPQRLMYKDSAR